MTDQQPKFFTQAWCRRTGIAALIVAGATAVASVPFGVLHDSVVHFVRFTGQAVPDRVTTSIAWWVCAGYWMACFGAILTAIYMAFLDFRFIRLRFAVESQELFRQSLGDDLAERVLRNKQPKN